MRGFNRDGVGRSRHLVLSVAFQTHSFARYSILDREYLSGRVHCPVRTQKQARDQREDDHEAPGWTGVPWTLRRPEHLRLGRLAVQSRLLWLSI